MFWRVIALSFIFFVVSGCSLQNLAVNTAGDLFKDASKEIETEGNFAMVEKGLPGNIKMLEGLLYLQPDNKDLLLAALKSYSAMAYMVNETYLMEDKFKDVDESVHETQAFLNYSKAIKYGLRLLGALGVAEEKLMSLGAGGSALQKYLSSQLGDGDLETDAVFFLAQSWGSLINLQKGNMKLIARLPLVKGLFDWTCGIKPDQYFGACDIFYAAYESGRPKMLGGNPQKGKELFKKLIDKNKGNLLARAAYLQFSVIPSLNKGEYTVHKLAINRFAKLFKESLMYPVPKNNPYTEIDPRMRIYVAMAIKRFKIIEKYENDLF